MRKSSRPYTLRRIPLLTICLGLTACSSSPPVKTVPVVVQCPKPQISPELLQPAKRQALLTLLDYLSPPEKSAPPTPASSTH